jgi:hypothetical protein
MTTTITLALAMSLVAIATYANAGENDRRPIGFNELIADVLPIYQKQQELAAIDTAPDEVAAFTAKKPEETAAWKNLRIGEFESDEAFKRRQEQARDQETKAYAAALEQLERNVASAAERRTAMASRREAVVRQDLTPNLVAMGLNRPIGVLVGLSQKPTLTLPYFDRTRMVFDHVTLPITTTEVAYQGSNAVLGRFSMSPADLQIKFGDLASAQKFKEDATAGRITFAVWAEPWLTQIESPIVTKAAHDDQEIDKAAVAASAFEYLIVAAASALGADPNSVNQAGGMAGDDVAHRDHHKLVHYPAETRNGVRFGFDLDTVLVAAVDDSGKQLPGVDIKFNDRPNVTVRVTGLRDDVQTTAKVLKRYDEILSVAGKKVRDTDDCIAAVKARPAGVTFVVCYRSVEDGREHTFVANGGQLLGGQSHRRLPGQSDSHPELNAKRAPTKLASGVTGIISPEVQYETRN